MKDPNWQTGTIYYYPYASHSLSSPGPLTPLPIADFAAKAFHPLGIGFNPRTRTLYVVNHSPAGPSIEVLVLAADGLSARHTTTLAHPLLHAPNSVVPVWGSDTQLLVTNDHGFTYESNRLLHALETYLALPLASIVHLDLETGDARVLDRLPFANGVQPLNATHLAVASTGLPAIFIYEVVNRTTHHHLTLVQRLRPQFWADNLSLDADGKLLCAGHPHPFETTEVSKTNRLYNLDGDSGDASLRPESGRPRAPSWVVEWDGNPEGRLRDVLISTEYGTATTASRDTKRKFGMVSGLYEKGLLVYNL
jgi:arylesterase/paraoxonase